MNWHATICLRDYFCARRFTVLKRYSAVPYKYLTVKSIDTVVLLFHLSKLNNENLIYYVLTILCISYW